MNICKKGIISVNTLSVLASWLNHPDTQQEPGRQAGWLDYRLSIGSNEGELGSQFTLNLIVS